jgi:hypothetical protein
MRFLSRHRSWEIGQIRPGPSPSVKVKVKVKEESILVLS